jgi:hypothetical protein
VTTNEPSVTENESNVTQSERDTSRARPRPLRGDVTVSRVTDSQRDVTERCDSDTAPLRSGGVTITSGSLENAWCLCWSHRQNALHIETLAQHLSLNRECYGDNIPGDFRVVLIGSEQECSAASDAVRSTLEARAAFRKVAA